LSEPGATPGSHALDWWRPAAAGISPAPATAEPSAEPGSRAAFWALLTFTFILLLAPQTFLPILATLRVALLAGGFAVAAYLTHCVLSGRPFIRLGVEMWSAAGMAAWAIVTLPLALNPSNSLSFLAGFYSKTLVIFWLLAHVVDAITKLRTVAWLLAFITLPLGFTSIGNFVGGRYLQSNAGPNRIVGYDAPLTADPNDLAMMLCILLPLSIGLLRIQRDARFKILLVATIAIAVTGITLTYSRAGFLVLVIVAVAYAWRLQGRRRLWILAGLFVPLMLIAASSPEYVERLATIFNKESDPTGSSQERWDDAVAAVTYVLQNPVVGAGIDGSAVALNELRGPTNKDVHNVYLQYAADLGIPGLVFFLVLLHGCFRSLQFVRQRCAGRPQLNELACLAESLSISLIAFAVGGLFLPMGYRLHFYYIGGLAVASRSICQSHT
jgi:probable O-glycosylation ligase (exosortase A-associated)